MFDTLLIANRGEIAVRIMRTARRLGLRTVAVYSDADRDALHVREADLALRLGPAPAAESYLALERLLEAALQSGADAVHPGYGFLAENPRFAEACTANGLVFVGPPAAAMVAMGAKDEAKRRMEAAGVPVVPGYHGTDQSDERLAIAARETGFPVLLKAAAGGGGKGMRLVEHESDLTEAIAAARREARSAFGDEQLIVERYLPSPRHIEVQVFADTHGDCVHLHERDCSVQRRHQKVLEEAPAPGLREAERMRMGETAVSAARAIGYVGAGTIELIYQDGEFFFMEMNTRLQVEHPVTELVTGVDLVEWQLRIAAGEPLPLAQEQIPLAGHAVEARIYAEAPARGYLPSVGRLERLVWPAAEAGVRIDAGVDAGDAITEHYDPMIAKLIVRGESRREALARLRAALDGTEILGVETNVALLRAVAAHPAFEAGGVSTRFLDEHHETLVGVPGDVADDDLALAALGLIGHLEREARRRGEASGDRWSPWLAGDAWRLNRDHGITLALVDEDGTHVTPTVARRDGQLSIAWDGKSRRGDGRLGEDDRVLARLDGRRLAARCLKRGHEIVLMREGRIRRVRLHDPAERDTASARAGTLSCPMPGQVIDLRVAAGDRVEPGDVLMVIEAMKMEHAVRAPVAGRVAELRYCVGDRVAEGEELLVLGPADD